MQTLTQRCRTEHGLTLVEVAVAVVVVAGLAAVALPSFRSQGSKGTDAEAKSTAIVAAKTIESCAAEHGGGYQGCTKDALLSIEPGLAGADDRLTVVATSSTYEIGVMSKRDPSVSFTVSKAADGTTTRTCETNDDPGGCRLPTTGTW